MSPVFFKGISNRKRTPRDIPTSRHRLQINKAQHVIYDIGGAKHPAEYQLQINGLFGVKVYHTEGRGYFFSLIYRVDLAARIAGEGVSRGCSYVLMVLQ